MKEEHVRAVIERISRGDENKIQLFTTIYEVAKDKVDRYPENAEGLLVRKIQMATELLIARRQNHQH